MLAIQSGTTSLVFQSQLKYILNSFLKSSLIKVELYLSLTFFPQLYLYTCLKYYLYSKSDLKRYKQTTHILNYPLDSLRNLTEPTPPPDGPSTCTSVVGGGTPPSTRHR